jgi:hypothetical protein
MSSHDEFSSPLPIYYSCKDANGESESTYTRLPSTLVVAMAHSIRGTEFVSPNNLRSNCIIQGFKLFGDRGQVSFSPEVMALLELEETMAQVSNQTKMIEGCRELLRTARTPTQWHRAVATTEKMAGMTRDPEIAFQLKQLIREYIIAHPHNN